MAVGAVSVASPPARPGPLPRPPGVFGFASLDSCRVRELAALARSGSWGSALGKGATGSVPSKWRCNLFAGDGAQPQRGSARVPRGRATPSPVPTTISRTRLALQAVHEGIEAGWGVAAKNRGPQSRPPRGAAGDEGQDAARRGPPPRRA